MKLTGTCDFCGRDFTDPGGIYNLRRAIVDRPQGWSGMFVWNFERMPEGCNFSPDRLEQWKVETKLTCRDCMRSEGELNKALKAGKKEEADEKDVAAKATVKPVKEVIEEFQEGPPEPEEEAAE